MRLVFLSNYYPPRAAGGYEQWCEEVARALAERGHDITVITSFGPPASNGQPGHAPIIRPVLRLEVEGGLVRTLASLLRREKVETLTLAAVRDVLESARPEAVLVWGMWNVPRSVPALVERLLPARTAYFFCDYWPTLPSAYLQQLGNPPRRKSLRRAKQFLTQPFRSRLAEDLSPRLDFRHPICVSRAVRDVLVQADIRVAHAEVVYGGTDVQRFAETSPAKERNGASLRLIYLGRLTPEKGVETAVRAIKKLAQEGLRVRLDVWGNGTPDYTDLLRKAAGTAALSGAVRFRGNIPRAQVPGLFCNYHALVFPSEWEEPFARTVLEAMAGGLPVIGTTTGGTKEILRNGDTGLTYQKGDVDGLADQIALLARNSGLVRRLGENGRMVVRRCFNFERMVVDLENALHRVANEGR